MPYTACDNECYERIKDGCVRWTGPSIPCINIESGKYYDEVIFNLATALCDLVSDSVSLECLFDNTCGEKLVPVPEAVQKIIDKVCQLDTSDIIYEGDTYCFSNLLPKKVRQSFSERNFTITSTVSNQGMRVEFDMTQPEGNGRSRVVVNGTGRLNKPNEIHNSNITSGHFTIPSTQFPADVFMSTEVGETELVTRLTFDGPQTLNTTYKASPLSTSQGVIQEDMIGAISQQVCANKEKLDDFDSFSMSGDTVISYLKPTLQSVVSVNSHELCRAWDILNNIKDVIVPYRYCKDNCQEVIINISLQEAFLRASIGYCNIQTRYQNTLTKYEMIKTKVDECCGAESDLPNLGGATGAGTSPQTNAEILNLLQQLINNNFNISPAPIPLQVNKVPISFVPQPTGNTQNLNQVVIDPNGNNWIIDSKGNAQRIDETAGGFEVTVPENGIVMKSPDGSKWKVTMDDNGEPQYEKI